MLESVLVAIAMTRRRRWFMNCTGRNVIWLTLNYLELHYYYYYY